MSYGQEGADQPFPVKYHGDGLPQGSTHGNSQGGIGLTPPMCVGGERSGNNPFIDRMKKAGVKWIYLSNASTESESPAAVPRPTNVHAGTGGRGRTYSHEARPVLYAPHAPLHRAPGLVLTRTAPANLVSLLLVAETWDIESACFFSPLFPIWTEAGIAINTFSDLLTDLGEGLLVALHVAGIPHLSPGLAT